MRKQYRSEDVTRTGRPEDCPKCPEYKSCSILCGPVSRWVDQDYKGRGSREILEASTSSGSPPYHPVVSFVDFAHQKNKDLVSNLLDPGLAKDAWDLVGSLRLGKKSQEFVELYYRDGKSLSRVAKKLKISSQACHYRHITLKKEVSDRLRRIEIWCDIKENYAEIEERSTKSDISVMLFFGGLYSPNDIGRLFGIHYTTTNKAVSVIKSRYS